MTNKKPKRIQDINGMFIYQDPKHGTVYYDIITKRAFNLTSGDLQACLYYNVLFPAALLISLSLISFMKVDYKFAIIVSFTAYVLAEILFRVCYFYKLPEVYNYKPIKKEKFIIRFAKKYSPQRLIVLAILFIGITICTIIYGKIENSLTTYAIYGGYTFATICIGGAIFSLIALIIKKKNNY